MLKASRSGYYDWLGRPSRRRVAGDKSGNWRQWYRQAIPRAEQLLEVYLKERAQEEGEER